MPTYIVDTAAVVVTADAHVDADSQIASNKKPAQGGFFVAHGFYFVNSNAVLIARMAVC